MSLAKRMSWGLAWAGLAIVVAVPSADYLTAQFVEGAPGAALPQPVVGLTVTPLATPASDALPAPQAEVAVAPVPLPRPEWLREGWFAGSSGGPTAEPQVAAADPVDTFLSGGRALPSYIDGGVATQAPATPSVAIAPASQAPAAAPALAAVDPVQTAAIAPAAPLVAPVPMPLWMRPPSVEPEVLTLPVRQPVPLASVGPADQGGSAVRFGLPPADGSYVSGDDLAGWETGPLSDYLAQRAGQGEPAQGGYNPNGFFLSDGQNPAYPAPSYRTYQPVQAPTEDDYFFPFLN